MKKSFFCFLFLFIFLFNSLKASEPKYYFDDINGYEGYSLAEYMGTVRTIDPEATAIAWEQVAIEDGAEVIKHSEKLTKQEQFLLWSALEEFEYKVNEVYYVLISQENSLLYIIAVVKNRGMKCDLYGGFYTAIQ